MDTGPGVGAWREKSPFYQWGWAKRGLAVDGAQSRPLTAGEIRAGFPEEAMFDLALKDK